MLSLVRKKQNTDYAIKLLIVQGKLYSEAKLLSFIKLLCWIIIPFAISVTKLVCPPSSIINDLAYLSIIISLFVGPFIIPYIKEKKEIAAYIQQQFDSYVYNRKWDRELLINKQSIEFIIAEKSKDFLQKNYTKEKLIDWYEVPHTTDSEISEIFLCQKQNLYWDSKLRKRALWANIVLLAIPIMLFILFCSIKNPLFTNILFYLTLIAPTFLWLIENIISLNKSIENISSSKYFSDNFCPTTEDEIEEVQYLIYLNRVSSCTIPNWFYKLFKEKDSATIENHINNLH